MLRIGADVSVRPPAGVLGDQAFAARDECVGRAAARRAHWCGVISVGQDITELMRGKKELASVANDLRMLIESANAPIFGVDNAGRVTEWNSKASHRKE